MKVRAVSGKDFRMMKFVSEEPIYKGLSTDKKFRAMDLRGKAYLLRIAPIDRYEQRKRDYEYTRQFLPLNVPMCEPLAFGIRNGEVYSIQKWIEGTDLQEVLPTFSPERQYAWGAEAGRTLRQMHRLPTPARLEAWEVVFRQKVDTLLEDYQNAVFRFPHEQVLIDCILQKTPCATGRPRAYLHGDYHVGNLMLGKDGTLYAIDFTSGVCCDPWMDFGSIAVSVRTSPAFACGLIDGYFDEVVPESFWDCLALYTCFRVLSYFTVSSRRIWDERYRKQILALAEDVLRWHCNMTLAVPTWYQPACRIKEPTFRRNFNKRR